jgi:chemotaxis protein methyltransferase CheR
LVEGGWLLVGPSEASAPLFSRFTGVALNGATFFQRTAAPLPAEPLPAAGTAALEHAAPAPGEPHGQTLECPGAPAEYSRRVRALANQGRLADALAWCDCWVAADKMEPAAHYLRAVVLLEQGEAGEARRSLRRALYLQPDFAMAHFASGALARAGGKQAQAQRHFAHAAGLLQRHPPHELPIESGGFTAGRLGELITAFEAAPAP